MIAGSVNPSFFSDGGIGKPLHRFPPFIITIVGSPSFDCTEFAIGIHI